ncbi:MAG: TonB-dependent receptor [Sphingomonadaceae bacterium]
MALRNGLTSGTSLGTLAIALGALTLPLTAHAQDSAAAQDDQNTATTQAQTDANAQSSADATTQAPDAGNSIVVTGYRQALETATNLKRNSPVIAEAFSAEDIGKLPDVSIAETLGRLPGLAVQRVNGRAQTLSIRGLGPDYSTTLLNGREIVSTSDNRSVEYDQYPAELINSGIVYKTPYAGLIGQGLAGTVDLRTIRPLSIKDRIISVNARAEFNDKGSLNPDIRSWGYRASGTYVNKFANDTLGLALGVAYQSSPAQIQRFNSWGYPQISQGDIDNGAAPAGSAGTTVLGGSKSYAKSDLLDRLGTFGTLEWQPTPEINSSLDVFYTKYIEKTPMRGIEFPLYPGWGATDQITSVGNPGGLADSVTYSGVQPVVRNDYDRKDTDTWAVGWNTKYENDHILVDVDLAYSTAKRRLQQIESYSGLSYGAGPGPSDTITYSANPSGVPFTFQNSIDYSDTSLVMLTDPRGWGAGSDIIQAGFINDTRTKDDLWSGRLEIVGKVDNPFIKQVVAGVAYSNRTKHRDILQNFLSLAGNGTGTVSGGGVETAPIPSDAYLGSIDALGFLGIGPQVAYDPFTLINNGTYLLTNVQSSSLPYPGNWTVHEKVWTGYLRADIDTMMGGMNVTGNFGGEFVFTDQSSDGLYSPGGVGAITEPVQGGAKYADFLPSLALNFNLTHNMKLRFGAARTLARARMDYLNASYNASISNTVPATGYKSIFSGSGGNPMLRPYRADGLDLSYEWYFARDGYVSVAGYYKWLHDFVNPNAGVLRDFSYLLPILSPTQQQAFLATGSNTMGVVSGPDNHADGHISGVEATLVMPLRTFVPALDGFGFQTSASYTDSQLNVYNQDGSSFQVTVPGLSKWVVNSTIFFEKNGFEARVSHRYRSEFLAEFPGLSASRDFRPTKPESIFDAQIGYKFQSGPLNGVGVTLQGLNLTDAPMVDYGDNDPSHVIDYESYGRTYLVGVSYRF